jgi:hypothetical protein
MGHEIDARNKAGDEPSSLSLGFLLELLVGFIGLLLIGAAFVLIVTPVGLLMRAIGKDPLRLRRNVAAKTYWIERQPPGPAPASLKGQF